LEVYEAEMVFLNANLGGPMYIRTLKMVENGYVTKEEQELFMLIDPGNMDVALRFFKKYSGTLVMDWNSWKARQTHAFSSSMMRWEVEHHNLYPCL